MNVMDQLANVQQIESAGIIGTFDGMHLGHRSLVHQLCEHANALQLLVTAYVFRQQPRATLHPKLETTYLCPESERIRRLQQAGIERLVQLEFNESIRVLRAIEFLAMLHEKNGLRLLLIGPGSLLGRDLLPLERVKIEAEQIGIAVHSATVFHLPDGTPVSSTTIREALATGAVVTATQLLGRRFALEGEVVPGDKRGRLLGFPTANLMVAHDTALPKDGIYATFVEHNNTKHKAATAIGMRPTFNGAVRTIETHIIDFSDDLYGQKIRIEFESRLRDEVKFDSERELITQMQKDVLATEVVLKGK